VVSRTVVFAFLSLIVVVATAGCSQEKKAETPEPSRPVKTVRVAAAEVGRMLSYSGSVKARYDVSMAFRIGGKIVERKVDIGQHVGVGDLLARIDKADYELAVSKAEADLDSASRQVDTYAVNQRRAQALFDQKVVSKSELDQRNLAYDQAVAARKAAVTAVDQAKNQLSYTDLFSTAAGIVTQVSSEQGQVISAGAPVVTISLDGEKEVVIAVPETDIGQFKVGKIVKATFWALHDLTLEGKVREVAGSANAQSRTFNVRVSLPQDDSILLGMTATIEAKGEDARPGFDLPLSALAKVDGQTVVWVVDPSSREVTMRPVKVGAFSASGLYVLDGVREGDLVVAAGTQFMAKGMKVAVLEDNNQTSAKNGG
jgi:membrane fusion protein, multidrug efflux system